MPAPRKYDAETPARAVRMYYDRIRDHDDSKLGARRYVGQLLDINPATLRNWVEQGQVDAGERPGTPTDLDQELRRLQRENAELRRANEILKTASAYFAAAELDRRFRSF